MRYAIISDIHANLQAWQAVKLDIEKEQVDMVICLGDVVGYGPDPAPVLESVFNTADEFVLGNHDAVVCNKLDASLFNDQARFIIEWTRQQLNEEAVSFFYDMPLALGGEEFLCVHAEAAYPDRFKYIYDPPEAMDSFEACDETFIFIGHTHYPGVIELRAKGDGVLHPPKDFIAEAGRRYMVNVGSVGDPRDGDIRASYVIFDEDQEQVQFRKVPFDVEAYRQALIRSKLPTQPTLFQYLHQTPEDHQQMAHEDREAVEKEMGFTARFAAEQPHDTGRAKIGTGLREKIKVKRRTEGGGVTFSRNTGPKGAAKWWKPKILIIAALLTGCLVGLMALLLMLKNRNRPQPNPSQAAQTTTPLEPAPKTPQLPAIDPKQEALEKQHRDWQNKIMQIEETTERTSEGFNSAIAELTAIQKKAGDTPAAREAQVVIDRLERERRELTKKILDDLESQAAGLMASNQFLEALDLVNEYTGPFTKETGPGRIEQARRYTTAWKKFENRPEQKAARHLETLCTKLAPLLFNLDEAAVLTTYKKEVGQARRAHPAIATDPLFQQLESLPDTLATFEIQIMNSFYHDLGKTITVHMLEGPLRLKITQVSEETIQAYQIISFGGAIGTGKEVQITYATLAPREKAKRLNKMDEAKTPSGLLIQGLFLAEAGLQDQAEACFENLEGSLGAAMRSHLKN